MLRVIIIWARLTCSGKGRNRWRVIIIMSVMIVVIVMVIAKVKSGGINLVGLRGFAKFGARVGLWGISCL